MSTVHYTNLSADPNTPHGTTPEFFHNQRIIDKERIAYVDLIFNNTATYTQLQSGMLVDFSGLGFKQIFFAERVANLDIFSPTTVICHFFPPTNNDPRFFRMKIYGVFYHFSEPSNVDARTRLYEFEEGSTAVRNLRMRVRIVGI